MGLETVVHHVCEKTSGLIVHVPDVDVVYQRFSPLTVANMKLLFA